MKKLIFILVIFICSNFVKATVQAPDYLHFENKKLKLHVGWVHSFSTLEAYYFQNNLDYPFEWLLNTGNYRGHVAIWEITDNKLYLKEIQIWNKETETWNGIVPKEYNIKSKKDNSNQDNYVFADWFSGIIACQEEDEDEYSYYFHIRYGEVLNTQILYEDYYDEDFEKVNGVLEKDTSNHELMNKYFMSRLIKNYDSYYLWLGVEDDEISMNNKHGRFKNEKNPSPFLELYSHEYIKFPYNWENFEKNGVPHCKWNIIDNKIYLEEIQLYSCVSFDDIEKTNINLEVIFNEKIANNKVFAYWLNGIYTIEYGTEKENINFPQLKELIPTEYTYLRIKNGIILESYAVPSDFNFVDIPENTDPGLKQILDELDNN